MVCQAQEEAEVYLSGEKLYGDDFSPEEIRKWMKEEENAYYDFGAGNRPTYAYSYHALNFRHAFSHLPNQAFNHVLGVGNAFGDELLPIIAHARRVTILDACSGFCVREIGGVPVTYSMPGSDGEFPFASNSFWCVLADEWVCRLPFWSKRYHPHFFWHKIRPWSAAYVLEKPN